MLFQWGKKQPKQQAPSLSPRIQVEIPNEGVKSKLIGRDGNFIRAIKNDFNVNLVIDDTQGVVFLEGNNNLNSVKGIILQMIQEDDFSLAALRKYRPIK